MPINVNNAFSLTGQRNINTSFNRLGGNLAKLASGKGINSAADNAAGLAIAEQLSADIRSAEQAQRNINDGASMARVAEGATGEIGDLLTRGRELAIQASNGTLDNEQRATIQKEVDSIKQEINRISSVTEFNGQKLMNGELAPDAANQVSIQAGIQSGPNDRLNVNVVKATDTASLGVDTVDVSTQQGARDALSSFDNALAQVTQTRGEIGALQNRLDSSARNLGVFKESLSAAESQIRGTDYASETSSFARNQIQSQVATNVLSQSNRAQAGVIGSLLNLKG
ncbi:MAG: flagellin FliC [Nitrospinae bacterium]|nr:flagellin FliC [Nitrospinota bacterium]